MANNKQKILEENVYVFKEAKQLLLEHGVTWDIFSATSSGDINQVTVELQKNRKLVNSKDYYGQTPLYLATINGHFDIVYLLLNTYKADITIKDNNGYTPLYQAIYQMHNDIVGLLVTHGANLGNPYKK